jgi:hypothetical protein
MDELIDRAQENDPDHADPEEETEDQEDDTEELIKSRVASETDEEPGPSGSDDRATDETPDDDIILETPGSTHEPDGQLEQDPGRKDDPAGPETPEPLDKDGPTGRTSDTARDESPSSSELLAKQINTDEQDDENDHNPAKKRFRQKVREMRDRNLEESEGQSREQDPSRKRFQELKEKEKERLDDQQRERDEADVSKDGKFSSLKEKYDSYSEDNILY